MEVIQHYQVFNSDVKKVEGLGQPCRASVQKEFKNVMDAKYIYKTVLRNIFGVAD